MKIFVEQMTPSASGNPRGITVVMIIRICSFYIAAVELREALRRQGPLSDYLNIERTRTDGNRFVRPNGDYTANLPLERPCPPSSPPSLAPFPLPIVPLNPRETSRLSNDASKS